MDAGYNLLAWASRPWICRYRKHGRDAQANSSGDIAPWPKLIVDFRKNSIQLCIYIVDSDGPAL
jgi:hypothetical protein